MLNRTVAIDGKVAEYGEEFGPVGLVFHHRLIAFLDVNGNVRADPYWLKGEVMPRVAGCSPEACRKMSAGLEKYGLAVRYEVDGVPYLHFPKFRENQSGLRVDREKPEVPVPQGFDESSGCLPEACRQTSGGLPANIPPEVEVEVEVEEEDVSVPAGTDPTGGSGADGANRPTDLPPPSKCPPYPHLFESAWSERPGREGSDPKKGAYRAWRARVRAGYDPRALHDGFRRYAAYCEERYPPEERRYVMRTETFFGPDEHWKSDWQIEGEASRKLTVEEYREIVGGGRGS